MTLDHQYPEAMSEIFEGKLRLVFAVSGPMSRNADALNNKLTRIASDSIVRLISPP
jgi:hypothetical protein